MCGCRWGCRVDAGGMGIEAHLRSGRPPNTDYLKQRETITIRCSRTKWSFVSKNHGAALVADRRQRPECGAICSEPGRGRWHRLFVKTVGITPVRLNIEIRCCLPGKGTRRWSSGALVQLTPIVETENPCNASRRGRPRRNKPIYLPAVRKGSGVAEPRLTCSIWNILNRGCRGGRTRPGSGL